MTSLFRTFVLAVLGLAFAAFGLIRAACASGGTGEAGRFAGVLPAFVVLRSPRFALAAIAAFAGLLSVVLGAIRLARRARDWPAVPSSAERCDPAARQAVSPITQRTTVAKWRRRVGSTFSGDKPWD